MEWLESHFRIKALLLSSPTPVPDLIGDPVKERIQGFCFFLRSRGYRLWIPAFAGMTYSGVSLALFVSTFKTVRPATPLVPCFNVPTNGK